MTARKNERVPNEAVPKNVLRALYNRRRTEASMRGKTQLAELYAAKIKELDDAE